MGADVHALWQGHPWRSSELDVVSRAAESLTQDPFVSFLNGIFGSALYSFSLSNAVIAWGEMLVECGCSLSEYIEVENETLRCLHYKTLCSGELYRVVRFVMFEEAKLAIEAVRLQSTPIFEAHPILLPGTWLVVWPSLLPKTLIWFPSTSEEKDGFRWIETGNVNIESLPFRVPTAAAPDNSWALNVSFHDARQQLFDQSRDDHGIVSSILVRVLRVPQETG